VKVLFATAAAFLALTGPAAAAAPELFVRTQRWDTHEETGPWLPLASAPVFNYLGGYEIGYKLQVGGFQTAALTVAGVPDGVPTQPGNDPYCVGRNGAAGDIVAAGPELQFEGSGTYTVKVSVRPGAGGPSDCLSTGESSTGSFSVDAPVAPTLAGTPLIYRDKPLRGNPFVGIQATPPPGGQAEITCTLGTAVIGPWWTLREDEFTRPGTWACVARGVAEGRDDNFETVQFGTPWSAPLNVEVRSDFRRKLGKITRLRKKRPRFTFTAEFPEAAAGGVVRVTLFRANTCKLRKVATYSGRFGPRRARFTMRRPRPGLYLGRFSFGGTALLNKSTDPNPIRLLARPGRMEFASAFMYPRC
jgi:hypothetical protein